MLVNREGLTTSARSVAFFNLIAAGADFIKFE
jgi:hypothetical protein